MGMYLKHKKIKIEVTLDDGSKISLILGRSSSKSKISKFLELLELMEERMSFTSESLTEIAEKSTNMQKVIYLIYSQFIGRSFTLKELITAFTSLFNTPLKRNTAATYLSRLVEQGILNRSGSRGSYRYVVVPPSKRAINNLL